MVTEMYNTIRDEAKRDAAKWNNPGDVDRGYQYVDPVLSRQTQGCFCAFLVCPRDAAKVVTGSADSIGRLATELGLK